MSQNIESSSFQVSLDFKMEWAATNRIPLSGMLEITNICNFQCVHCYVTNTKNQTPCFLSFDIIKSVIDEVSEIGCEYITITGGECLLHPDFEKIYTYIWQKGIKVNTFSNASLITDSTISLFKKYPPESIEVSIYGASDETYKQVTKVAQFANVLNGLELLRANEINLVLKIIVLKQNEHEFEEMKKLVGNYTKNPLRFSNNLMPSYDFSSKVLDNQSNILKHKNQKNNIRDNHQAFGCKAGKSSFFINYEGNVTLCLFCGFSAMSLKHHSFRDIWEAFGKAINLSIPKDSKCYDCAFLNECRNCPAKTWMFNQKIGLYPIPKCKLKGEHLMTQAKKLFPSNFVIINGIPYFRLENGTVSVETPKHVTINVSVQDDVELVTLSSISKEVNFWKVTDLQDNIYSLASPCHIAVPKDITFEKLYFSKNYPEGVYVKYFSAGNCGILYVSETEVSTVISHTEGYSEICFENELFYAERNDTENKYHLINEANKLLGTFSSRCKKLNDYLLFYDDNKIFVGSDEYEIPGGITSIEVFNKENIILVKVVNNNGVYYYTKDISYLLGPIQEHSIITINENTCYITETVNEKIINVFYLSYKNEAYTCETLSCDTGIIMQKAFGCDFFSTNNSLYVFSDEKFSLLFSGIDVDRFCFKENDKNLCLAWHNIVGFKNNIPVLHASFDLKNKTAYWHFFTIIDSDFDDGIYICKETKDDKKKQSTILVIDKYGNLILNTLGEHCYKKYGYLKKYYEALPIYIVENYNGEIHVYDNKGYSF